MYFATKYAVDFRRFRPKPSVKFCWFQDIFFTFSIISLYMFLWGILENILRSWNKEVCQNMGYKMFQVFNKANLYLVITKVVSFKVLNLLTELKCFNSFLLPIIYALYQSYCVKISQNKVMLVTLHLENCLKQSWCYF